MLKNITKIFIIFCFALLASCQKDANINIGQDGVSVTTSGANISVSQTGIVMDGLSVTNSGISLNLATLANMANTNNQNSEISLSDEEKSQFSHLSAEAFEVKSCDTQFNQLVKTFGNNYDACFVTRKPINHCSSERKVAKVNVAIILDASGSMGAKIGGETMMEIAKSEVKNYISSLDNAVSGSLIVYGHKGSSRASDSAISCGGIENFGNFSDKNALVSKISGLQATGWTPLAKSLEEAKKYLDSISSTDDQKVIVLISDGKETCGGNPTAVAKNIASEANYYIDVIGFNVAGETQKELQNIALAGGGKYSDVRSRLDFQNVFADMKAFSREISCGASEASIALRDAADTLGTYYSCMYNLREEEVKIMTHMTMSCQSEVTNLMENRVNEISSKLKNLETDAKNRMENFEKSIEDVIEKF